MTITIIGTGLIGGSMALALKEKGFADKIIGVDDNIMHQRKALELYLVDEVLSWEDALPLSDLVILAVPVNIAVKLLPLILDLTDKQVLMDVGSTKEELLNVIAYHTNRRRFVGTHPMWGTENSGPASVVRGAFVNRATVICNKEKSDIDAINMVEKVYRALGMRIVYMDAKDHDVHVAYVSHISHIISFALANTVLEKEREEDTIFELASGGFESTVRLAKSDPLMWLHIFIQNRENILDVLNEHISQLRKFKVSLEKGNYVYLQELIENANGIRRILK
ncbi:MAG: prephenate dehydrogenase [Chitinophagaceae bacterium]|nr:prephenate dehydrogenase [Chitinophagaceae bacterium]